MFTVALIGPDGAGKTTVGRRLEHVLPMKAKYLYMGVNWDASNHLLPTTRLVNAIRRARGSPAAPGGPPEHSVAETRAHGRVRRGLGRGWRALALANRVAEEWYRQLVAYACVRRGAIVIFDRHFFSDYYAHDVAGAFSRTLDRRIHGFLLAHVYPKPDLVIYLDAPAETLLARKGEGTLASLERRRRDYLDLASKTKHFVVVDGDRSLGEVTEAVAAAIEGFSVARSQARHAARSLQDETL
jgi:thymidylate kinase